jgi:CHAT domain-containing protein
MRWDDIGRYPSVTAQCAWNEGLIETGLRHYDRAKAAYESARRLFNRMGDTLSALAVDVRLEENERFTGDIANAWSHMSRALRNGVAGPAYIPLSEAGRVAEAAEMPFAALAFYDDGIAAAHTPAEHAHGRLSRAKLLWKLGRQDDARIDLNAATRFANAIGDPTSVAALDGYLTLARSTLIVASRPEEVIQQLDRAVTELAAGGNRREIAQARCLQAKAHIGLRDTASAEQSLQQALAEIQSQREEITTDEERLALIDTTREATEILVGLLFDANRSDDSLLAAESSKARLLLDVFGRNDQRVDAGATARPEAGEAFVEYFVLPDRVLVWSLGPSGTQARAIAVDRRTLEQQIGAWQGALLAGESDRVRSEGKALSDLLLRPIWSEVSSSHRLFFAADGPLQRLPFAALASPSGTTFLVEDREISIVPSLAWLAARRRAPPWPLPLARVVATVPSPNAGDPDPRYMPLPAAEQDARAIAIRFPGSRILTGDEATSSVVAAAAPDADLFHFSGHAVIDARRPARSSLVMTGGQLLRASDIAQWRLQHTSLVVLAACASGAGRSTSDGTASLARAFLVAGSRSAVATLWPIQDDAASELSRHFYDALASGSNAREALRAAQRFMIHSTKSRSQYDWAAFQFIGS